MDFIDGLADFKPNERAVALGSQGPDIFFFTNPLSKNSMRKIGSSLHRTKPEKIFDSLAEYIKNCNSDTAKSYAYGFILHYALDRKCHPFVYSQEKRIVGGKKYKNHFSVHNKIEMSLDGYMLYRKMNIEKPLDFSTADTINFSENEMDEIAKITSFLVNNATRFSIKPKDVLYAIKSTKKMQKILTDKNRILTFLCVILETIFAPLINYFKFSAMIRTNCWKKGIKYANINNDDWNSPFDENLWDNSSFEELFEKAEQEAKELLFGFEQIINGKSDGKTVTNNISFLTGREVQ